MINAQGEIIYIGKAKNLKKRVSSYFNRTHTSIKTTILVSQIIRIEPIATQTEQEAFILENQLIKKHLPKYNIALKDDKNYPFIKLTIRDDFPKIEMTRQKIPDGSMYFGPFPYMGSTIQMKRTLQELFSIRDCKQPISLDTPEKKCILMDIHRCLGPCIQKTVQAQYQENIQELILFLSGKNQTLLNRLKIQMQTAVQALEFEKAAKIRDKLLKLEAITQKQTVYLGNEENIHVWATSENETYFYAIVLSIIQGKLLAQQGFYSLKTEAVSESHFLDQTLSQYYQLSTAFPKAILCTEKFPVILNTLIAATQSFTPISAIQTPQIGHKKHLLDMAIRNAKLSLNRLHPTISKPAVHFQRLLQELQSMLRLKAYPQYVLGVDISHLSGNNIVGATVWFENGFPEKKGYRLFNMRTVHDTSNDPQSIYETVLRRLSLAQTEPTGLPHLILIDGGRAQLNFAERALMELGLTHIDMISLAKENEEIYTRSTPDPIVLPKNSPQLHFLQQVRDEVHRFAITAQRKTRQKTLTHSRLSEIKGLGEKRITLLIRQYKTIERIRQLTPAELALTLHIGSDLANSIKDQLM